MVLEPGDLRDSCPPSSAEDQIRLRWEFSRRRAGAPRRREEAGSRSSKREAPSLRRFCELPLQLGAFVCLDLVCILFL